MHRVRRFAVAVAAVALASAPAMAAAAEEAEHHEASLMDFFWPVVNFAILCWVLYYFLKAPLSTYLKDRGASIRKDLVDAAAIKNTATAQLEEIDRKLKALPGEIDSLRTRGQEEIAAEERRIAEQAAAERDRLLDQARRDIDVQVRLAKRALTEHAANLAVKLATDRIASGMTPADQDRLVDRYLEQVKH
ncbi:MAG: ATP synthase F0 subunit B [Acidobacteria bacterium]|nr:ATP synthase F0 subunit B [Acidobacteriota bacterium]